MSLVVLAQTFYKRWRLCSSEPTVWKMLVFNKSNPFCSERCWILCRGTYNADFTYVHTPLWRVRFLRWHELMFTRLLHGSSSELRAEILWTYDSVMLHAHCNAVFRSLSSAAGHWGRGFWSYLAQTLGSRVLIVLGIGMYKCDFLCLLSWSRRRLATV